MENLNIRLPEEQLRILDKQVRKMHYTSRSEYVREALRKMMENQMDLTEETIQAINKARKQKSTSHTTLKRRLGIK